MSSNFQIFVHRNSENLHLKLKGDFDDSSACELFNVLEKNSEDVIKVYVHTSNLNKISPSGVDIFHHDKDRIKNFSSNIKFTGKNAIDIAFSKNNIC